MMRTIVIKYKGILLECRGYHTPAHTPLDRDIPPDYESFEIDTVCYNDTDVTEIFSTLFDSWDEIEELCLEEIR